MEPQREIKPKNPSYWPFVVVIILVVLFIVFGKNKPGPYRMDQYGKDGMMIPFP